MVDRSYYICMRLRKKTGQENKVSNKSNRIKRENNMKVLKVTAQEVAMRQCVTENEYEKRNGTGRERETNSHKEYCGRCLIIL